MISSHHIEVYSIVSTALTLGLPYSLLPVGGYYKILYFVCLFWRSLLQGPPILSSCSVTLYLVIFGATKVSCEFVARLPQIFVSDQATVPFFPAL